MLALAVLEISVPKGYLAAPSPDIGRGTLRIHGSMPHPRPPMRDIQSSNLDIDFSMPHIDFSMPHIDFSRRHIELSMPHIDFSMAPLDRPPNDALLGQLVERRSG